MYSRREFLLRTFWLVMLPGDAKAFAAQRIELGVNAEFTPAESQVLGAAMDEIVPAGDGMPSATAAGGLQYLRYLGFQYPEIEESIQRTLVAITEEAREKCGSDFPQLHSEERVQILAALELKQPAVFSSFTGYVYEAYYTSPRVLGLLACPAPAAPLEDEDALLAPVRKMVHVYRQVP